MEKDSKVLKFVPGYFKTNKKCVKKLLKKLLFAIIHVPDQHKTPQMCKNVNSKKKKNPGMLQFNPNRYKIQKISEKQLIIIFMY